MSIWNWSFSKLIKYKNYKRIFDEVKMHIFPVFHSKNIFKNGKDSYRFKTIGLWIFWKYNALVIPCFIGIILYNVFIKKYIFIILKNLLCIIFIVSFCHWILLIRNIYGEKGVKTAFCSCLKYFVTASVTIFNWLLVNSFSLEISEVFKLI